jgi:hypothetical protein
LVAAGVRLAPTVAAASSETHVFYVGDTEIPRAGMMRRAFEVAPDSIHSIAVADLEDVDSSDSDSAECTGSNDSMDDVVRTQPNSIRVVQVDAETPGPCAKLMRVCAVWGPTSLRDLFVFAQPARNQDVDPGVIEEALTHCTGGLTHLRVPNGAILAPARARSFATAPPAWMATVRLLSVAITSDCDLMALAEAPRHLPSLADLTMCVRNGRLTATAWRRALHALLPQLTAFSLEGSNTSLADPSIFTNFWDRPAGPQGGFRRPRAGDDGPPQPSSAPIAVAAAAFPLERLKIDDADVGHGPLLSLVAAHAPNLSDLAITGGSGEAAPGLVDALAAMRRCRSLTLLLRELTDEHIARILRGGMCDSLRNCKAQNTAVRGISFGARNTVPVFSDLAAFDGVVCPKVRKATFLPRSDCTRSVFPNARWPEDITAAPG